MPLDSRLHEILSSLPPKVVYSRPTELITWPTFSVHKTEPSHYHLASTCLCAKLEYVTEKDSRGTQTNEPLPPPLSPYRLSDIPFRLPQIDPNDIDYHPTSPTPPRKTIKKPYFPPRKRCRVIKKEESEEVIVVRKRQRLLCDNSGKFYQPL